MASKILRIDASARAAGSVTRELNIKVIADLTLGAEASVTQRDLSQAIP